MAIIEFPSSLKVEKMTFGRNTYDLPFSNADTGASSTRLLGPPRWTLALSSAQDLSLTESGNWIALMLALGGRVNHLEVWDIARPAPQGTCRGALTLGNSVAIGDVYATISAGVGQAGKTLLPGDWLQLGTGLGTSQLVSVVYPAQVDASGIITVEFQSPARMGFYAGTPVTWDKPKAYFKSNSSATSWSSERVNQGGFSFDGTEQWNA